MKTDYKVKYRKKVMLSNEYFSTLDPIFTYKVKIKTIPDWTSNIEIEKKYASLMMKIMKTHRIDGECSEAPVHFPLCEDH